MTDLDRRLSQQRVKHLVQSYRLAGEDEETFARELAGLMELYPLALLELAIAETLAAVWLTVPLPRGRAFLARLHHRLQQWREGEAVPHLTPAQFQQISGLDPAPVFGPAATPSQSTPPRS